MKIENYLIGMSICQLSKNAATKAQNAQTSIEKYALSSCCFRVFANRQAGGMARHSPSDSLLSRLSVKRLRRCYALKVAVASVAFFSNWAYSVRPFSCKKINACAVSLSLKIFAQRSYPESFPAWSFACISMSRLTFAVAGSKALLSPETTPAILRFFPELSVLQITQNSQKKP